MGGVGGAGGMCGAMSQACCGTTAAPKCNTGLGCRQNGTAGTSGRTCENCGAPGDFCCAGTSYCQTTSSNPPNYYCRAPDSVCTVCGGMNQYCCPNSLCGSGLECDGSTSPATCQTCGAADQRCCAGGVCNVTYACAGRVVGAGGAGGASNPGVCKTCGTTAGSPCCPTNPRCTGNGLTCNSSGTCVSN